MPRNSVGKANNTDDSIEPEFVGRKVEKEVCGGVSPGRKAGVFIYSTGVFAWLG